MYVRIRSLVVCAMYIEPSHISVNHGARGCGYTCITPKSADKLEKVHIWKLSTFAQQFYPENIGLNFPDDNLWVMYSAKHAVGVFGVKSMKI